MLVVMQSYFRFTTTCVKIRMANGSSGLSWTLLRLEACPNHAIACMSACGITIALRSIILHIGQPSCGHYRAVVRGYNGVWALCDGPKISTLREASVFPGQKNSTIYKQAYVLLYDSVVSRPTDRVSDRGCDWVF